MTLDLRDLHLERPHRRDRQSPPRQRGTSSSGIVNLCDLAGADHELAFAAIANLAGDGTVEEAMPEPFDDKPFETVERLADLSARGALELRFGSASAHCAAEPSCP